MISVIGKSVLPADILDSSVLENSYKNNPDMFNTCKAWNNNEVYLEMAYNAYYTNYEIALINTWYIAKTVYPELFKDVEQMRLLRHF